MCRGPWAIIRLIAPRDRKPAPGPGFLAALALALAVSCRPVAPPASPRPAADVAAARARAVLISFDGVSGQRLERLLADPAKLPAGGFRGLAARGFHAVRSIPPTPSLTAVSHVTHVTGALPQVTGIVANTFRDFSKPFPQTISGFAAPIRAETLWQAARRQGKKVGVMLYPGADGNGPERTADWMMTWPGDPIVPGRLHELAAAAWEIAAGSGVSSFSPAKRTTLPFAKTAHAVELWAVDRTNDSRADYGRLLLRSGDGTARELAERDWFPVEVPGDDGRRTGAWCKVLRLAPDLSKVEIYVGPLSYSTGHPADWVRTLDERIGFWPGAPDDDAFGADSEHPEVFLEQAERLVDFLTRADQLALARPDWDLLLVYQPQVDEVSHEFLLIDPAQPGFTPERSARFLALVEKAYDLTDRSLRAITDALGRDDSIFVTSDHGMTPLHTEIAINQILLDAGLLKLDERGRIASGSDVVAVPSSAIANLYVNPASDRAALARAEKVLRDYRAAGSSPFDRIVRREDAGSLGLNTSEAGDLIALTRPGFIYSSRVRSGASPVGKPYSYGGHGNVNIYPEIDATFFAAGPGIARGRTETIGSWEIAARVAAALGIEPPRHAARPGR